MSTGGAAVAEYAYLRESRLGPDGGLRLQTSGAAQAHPRLFSGFVTAPAATASGQQVVAATALATFPIGPSLREALGRGRLEGENAVGDGDSGARRVRPGERGYSCTCTWWDRYHGERGPCAHVLAVQLVRRS